MNVDALWRCSCVVVWRWLSDDEDAGGGFDDVVGDGLEFVDLEHSCDLGEEAFEEAEVAAIERLTRGNFRVVERLFPQIKRVLKINELETITDDVIEAAASTLVLGH